MNKSVITIFCFIVILSMVSFSSAGYFGDFWNKITGKIVEGTNCTSNSDCVSGKTCDLYFNIGECKTPTNNYYSFCSDSDGGYNSDIKGTVTYKDSQGVEKTATDVCIGNSIMEAICDYNGFAYNGKTFTCPNGCSDGACVGESNVIPTETNGYQTTLDNNISLKNNITDEGYDLALGEKCNGCMLNEKCYPLGYRNSGNYCSDIENSFTVELEENSVCENNFECKGNICIDNLCASGNLFQKLLEWIKSLFDK